MNQAARFPTNDGPLVRLVYELLDAHLDTVELMDPADEFRSRVHLDYLRGLVRKTEELLAEARGAESPAAASPPLRSEEAR
jgi:hypothetical protein